MSFWPYCEGDDMVSLTRFDSYEGIEQKWQGVLATCPVDTLFITPQWQRVWWEQFGGRAEMMLLCLEGNNRVEGIAPLARVNGTISFIGSQDLFDYNDFPVPSGAEASFYPSLLRYLDGEEWGTIELSSLSQDSPTLTYLPGLARERGYSVEIEEEDVVPGLDLPDNWDLFLQLLSKKDRHELRRKMRRLDSLGEEFSWYKRSEPAEVEKDLDDFFSLMRFSKEDKNRFLTGPREQFFRNIAREMAGLGIFKLFFLEIKGHRVASAMCFDYGTSRLLYNSGFDPNYGYYSVGLLLKALCMKDAIEEGMTYFDFLRGPEPYKYDLGGRNKTLYKMVVRRS